MPLHFNAPRPNISGAVSEAFGLLERAKERDIRVGLQNRKIGLMEKQFKLSQEKLEEQETDNRVKRNLSLFKTLLPVNKGAAKNIFQNLLKDFDDPIASKLQEIEFTDDFLTAFDKLSDKFTDKKTGTIVDKEGYARGILELGLVFPKKAAALKSIAGQQEKEITRAKEERDRPFKEQIQVLDIRAKELAEEKAIRELEKPREEISPFAKISPKDYTPESVEVFEESGDFSDLVAIGKVGTQKSAQNFILDSGEIVLSYDGGRTYATGGETTVAMPPTATKIPAGATMTELRAQKARQQAKKEIAGAEGPVTPAISPEEAARGGTGPYAKLAAAVDSILGGILNIGSIFPETQENRQVLRLIKQTGKAALLNSARGAIWEQQKIDELFADPDKFWANPDTEARKFQLIRSTLKREKISNNKAISTAITVKEIEKLRQSNQDIDRTLAIIGTGEQTQGETTRVTMPDGSIQTFDESGKRIQ